MAPAGLHGRKKAVNNQMLSRTQPRAGGVGLQPSEGERQRHKARSSITLWATEPIFGDGDDRPRSRTRSSPVPISLQWEWAALAENGKSEIRRMNSALRISTGPSVYRRHRHRHLRLFPVAHSAVARELRTPTHPLAHSPQADDSFTRAMPSRGASGGSDSNPPRICNRYRS